VGVKTRGLIVILTIPCDESQTYRVLKPYACNEWLINMLSQQGEVRMRVQQVCIHLYDCWYDHRIRDKTIKKNIKGSSQIENYQTIETIIVLTQKKWV
jgi:hypothetical protein